MPRFINFMRIDPNHDNHCRDSISCKQNESQKYARYRRRYYEDVPDCMPCVHIISDKWSKFLPQNWVSILGKMRPITIKYYKPVECVCKYYVTDDVIHHFSF